MPCLLGDVWAFESNLIQFSPFPAYSASFYFLFLLVGEYAPVEDGKANCLSFITDSCQSYVDVNSVLLLGNQRSVMLIIST